MMILEYETYHGEFQSEQSRTGRKYTTKLERLEETTDDHMQQEVDTAMNAGINAQATRLHQDEEETWYFPRTEYEEDQLIQHPTIRINEGRWQEGLWKVWLQAALFDDLFGDLGNGGWGLVAGFTELEGAWITFRCHFWVLGMPWGAPGDLRITW